LSIRALGINGRPGRGKNSCEKKSPSSAAALQTLPAVSGKNPAAAPRKDCRAEKNHRRGNFALQMIRKNRQRPLRRDCTREKGVFDAIEGVALSQ